MKQTGVILSRSSVYATLRSIDAAAANNNGHIVTCTKDSGNNSSSRRSSNATAKTPTITAAAVAVAGATSTVTDPTSSPALGAIVASERDQPQRLLQFYAKLSEDFHRRSTTRSRGLDCKNTSGRPISVSDVSNRLVQRSLTLTGGGYNKTPNSSQAATTSNYVQSTKNEHPSTSVLHKIQWSRRKQKLQRDTIVQRLKDDTSCIDPKTPNQQRQSLHFLQQLNAQWNQYMITLLQCNLSNEKEVLVTESDTKSIQDRLQSVIHEIEWVGACVEISETGRQGILVGQTMKTWRIVPMQMIPNTSIINNSHTNNNTNNNKKKANNAATASGKFKKTLTIPKRNQSSSLVILIPLSLKMQDDASKKWLRILLRLQISHKRKKT